MKQSTWQRAAPLLAACMVQAQIWGNVVNDYSTTELAAIFEKANASNTISMPFYDLSQNYTQGAKNDTDWDLDLRIVADIAVPGSDNEFVTGFQLSLIPPSSMLDDEGQLDVAEDHWYTCQNWIIARKVKEDEIHPRCEGMVSDECFEALQRAADSEECIQQDAYDACAEGNGGVGIGSMVLVQSNSTWSLTSESWGDDASETHQAGETKRYDESIQNMYILIATPGRYSNDSDNGTQDRGSAEGSRLRGTVSCIRAESFAEGSRTRSTALTLEIGVISSFVVSAAAVMMLW